MLEAGTGRADITPPVGIAHVNWGARTHDVAEAIHLPLCVTVLVLRDDAATLAIADVDTCLMPESDAAPLREVIAEAAGTSVANVRLACSHAIQNALEVADRVYKSAGTSAIFLGTPFERRFRDIHTLSQQIQSRDAHFEMVGRVMLKGDPDGSFMG